MTNTGTDVPQLLQRMEGLIVALATPLDDRGNLDLPGLNRLLEAVIAGGTSCIFPLGWCGEQPLLTRSVQESVMRETVQIVGGRLPVMMGITEQSLPRSVELAELARQAGADLLLATPPYSYPIPQPLVFEYFRDLAGETEMPVVIYRNDEVGVGLEFETLLELSQVPGIVGVKAYAPFPELRRYYHRMDIPGRFAVISGDEYLYGAALGLGIKHYTMGGPGNFCPGWCTAILQDAASGDWDAVREKQKQLTDFCDAIYLETDSPYAAVKYVLELLGLCAAHITSPHRALPADQKQKVEAAVDEFGDILH